MATSPTDGHAVVDRSTWLDARRDHLEREKELTRQRDELSAARRELPWLEITADYRFETATGSVSLADLFDGRRQLLVYHFMMGPDWEEGCPSCSFWADNYEGTDVHLAHRDTTLAAVSRAPIEAIEAYRQRMGWTFTWVSSQNSPFNFDMRVSFDPSDPDDQRANYNFGTQDFPGDEAPGFSAFLREDDGRIYLTYQTFSRGLDMTNGAYHMLDLTALGRHEDDLPWSMAWLHRHDAYPD
jgi:predicted dithiol-disulfide oxidoreductase (DUF899 family)